MHVTEIQLFLWTRFQSVIHTLKSFFYVSFFFFFFHLEINTSKLPVEHELKMFKWSREVLGRQGAIVLFQLVMPQLCMEGEVLFSMSSCMRA